jgi:hypothetical protein
VLVAATVYGGISLLRLVHHVLSGPGAELLAFVVFVLTYAGPALVQGALVEIVRNVHVGRKPDEVRRLFAVTGGRVVPLVGASVVYVLGVVLGLLLLVVPGLVVLARWSLMPPLVVLERRSVTDARHRSRELVKGQSVEVFACLLVGFAVEASFPLAIAFGHVGFGTTVFSTFVWSSLTAPFAAHLLTVIYYRRSEPGVPVIHPGVLAWRDVWQGR